MIQMAFLFAATPEEVLYGYGPLGVGVVVFAWFGYKIFNIILKDRDKAFSDRDKMVEDLFTKVLPAIARNTDVLQGRQDIDRDLVEAIKQSNAQLERNTRAFDEVSYMLRQGQGTNRVGGT